MANLQLHQGLQGISVRTGSSSLALLEARSDLILTTIDIQAQDSPFGSLYAERKAVEVAGFQDRLFQIHGDSKTVGQHWNGEQFNMVFIDGDHSYEGCSGDIVAWMPHLKVGGIMAVHDYEKHKAYDGLPSDAKAPHPKPFPELDRAVDELLLGSHEWITHVRSLIAFRRVEHGK